jgi:uncharacterized membrane protein YoaK (UPF0700 family)
MEALIWGAIAVVLIALMMQRWFWSMTFTLAQIAALFAMIASIIHFQILAAVGLFVLLYFLSFIKALAMDD